MTMTMQATWRKTKDGQWVVQGPAELVVPGRTVDVAKKNGGYSRVTIESVGKAFDRDGITYRYGYTGQQASSDYGSYGDYGRDRYGRGWNGRGTDPRQHDPGCTGPDGSCSVCFDD